ncbi:hypothetical protein DPMN_007027 [Dreissena polymorpha]|uniref:Z-binding domain-containing protein n=2 Tax=Dreissena polymorpha TaxID=45954 RepID=A0A9D4RVY0_DREPO|nr:hypothetical protein DPMN_007027 [Dreissena polymorpha]
MNSQDTDMEGLFGVLFTIFEEAKGPLSVGNLCATTEGLRSKEESVAKAVKAMCDNDILTVSDNKYMLKERVSQLDNDKGNATIRRASYQNKVESSGRSPVRPVASGEARSQGCTPAFSSGTDLDTARLQSFSVGQDSAIVLRTDRAVVTSRNESSTSMTVLGSDKDQYFDIMTKIVEYMKKQCKPVKAHLVAKAIDIGSTKSDVNRYLYCLEKNGVLEKIGGKEWQIKTKSDVSEQDLDKYASVMAGKLSSTSKAHKSNSTTEMDGGCVCPKRGPSCNHYHITNNIQNNVIIGDRIAKSDALENPGS